MKLVRSAPGVDLETLNNESPYLIMFGPDKCGANTKIHFILQHYSPVSLKWEEKHFNESIAFPVDRKAHLYTLHISPDNSFAIYVDLKEVAAGSLLTHMIPPVNPPKTIPDPADRKPADWADEERIADPAAKKPDDW